MGENLALLKPTAPDGQVVHDWAAPLHRVGGLAVLRGSLAPNGAVVKVAGIDVDRFEGTARVFDGEQDALDAVLGGRINAGDIVVIRYVAPEAVDGGPIAFVAEGDRIVIDVASHSIDLLVDDATLARRREGWKPLEP